MKPGLAYKLFLVVLAIAFLAGAGVMQRGLDAQRVALIPKGEELVNAPPMLRFVTVALGGFRGLISNALWIRVQQLQEEDKFFEMVQLADWITKLQPRLKQVWIVQAWNMSYNISVKFTSAQDRWRWVQRGISLLRDEGLRYNPDEALIYRELAWHFQHKLGLELDDAHFYYKAQWAKEMTAVLGTNQNGYLELLDPRTDDARARAQLLREKYKLDPRFMAETDKQYGPLEWRLPEAHAIYWAFLGLKKSRPEDLRPLRQIIHQALQVSFRRGRIVGFMPNGVPVMAPKPEVMTRLDQTFRQEMQAEPAALANIKNAHRNFVREAVETFYAFNRLAEARRWFNVLNQDYPDDPQVKKAGGDLDTFCLQRLTQTVSESGRERTEAVVAAYLSQAYFYLVQDQDDDYTNLRLMAQKIWTSYQSRLGDDPKVLGRMGLRPLAEIDKIIREQLLAPGGMDPRLQAVLRAKLNLPPPSPTK